MTALSRINKLREEGYTRVQIAAAAETTVSTIDGIIRNKKGSEEMEERVGKLSDAAMKKVKDLKDVAKAKEGNAKAKKAKKAPAAKKVAKKAAKGKKAPKAKAPVVEVEATEEEPAAA